MDAADKLEKALAAFLTDSGLPDVYAWGDDRPGDALPIEHVVTATRIMVENYPGVDMGTFDVRIATKGGAHDDNRVEELLGPQDLLTDRLYPYARQLGLVLKQPDYNHPHEKTLERGRKERVFVFQIKAYVSAFPDRAQGRRLEVDDREVHVDDRPVEIS